MDRTTRTCSAILALVAALVPMPALAKRDPRSPLGSYVQARLADSAGDPATALAGYTTALAAEPDNAVIAMRAYRQAIATGDRRQAIRSAEQLTAAQVAPIDVPLLLFGERLGAGDIAGARTIVDRIEDVGNFTFIAPMLRAWTGFAARDAQPALALDTIGRGSIASGYATEQRALLLLASGQKAEALTIARALSASDARLSPFRVTMAATLQRQGDKAAALDMLSGTDHVLVLARAQVEAGKELEGDIRPTQSGTALLYARIADDLTGDRTAGLALTLARFASFLDGTNPYMALVLGRALAAGGRDNEALAAVRTIDANGPWRGARRTAEIALLDRMGSFGEAVALAKAAADAPGAAFSERVRLGELYERQKQYDLAAGTYAEAIRAVETRDGQKVIPWALWMLHGAALERGGHWDEAQKSLRKALVLAPDQPTPYNHLGYAMLERRENIAEAMRLIQKANSLKPDDVAITDSLGWAYFLNGDVQLAVATLEKAVSEDPYEATLGEHLGDAYWAAGRRIDARYAWSAALAGAEDASVARLRDKIDIGLTRQNAAR